MACAVIWNQPSRPIVREEESFELSLFEKIIAFFQIAVVVGLFAGGIVAIHLTTPHVQPPTKTEIVRMYEDDAFSCSIHLGSFREEYVQARKCQL